MAEEGVILLGIAEDEDVVLPPVVLPAALVLFTDVAFCANVEIVVKLSGRYHTHSHHGRYDQTSKFESFFHRVF